MSSRLITAVEAFLKHLEHLVGLEPTSSVQAHIPVPELTELRAAHAEATAPPPRNHRLRPLPTPARLLTRTMSQKRRQHRRLRRRLNHRLPDTSTHAQELT